MFPIQTLYFPYKLSYYTWATCGWRWQSFVSSYHVLTFFLHWIYKMKYSCYQDSFVINDWLVYWVLVEKCTAQEKEIGNHKLLLLSVLRLAGCLRRLKRLKWFWPYLICFLPASPLVRLSNFIAFDVFFFFHFFFCFWFHEVWPCLCRHFTQICKI